jgi:hypothetical protein
LDPDPDPASNFDPDPDPDPAYHVDADPEADPNPTCYFDAYPCGSGSTTLAGNEVLFCQDKVIIFQAGIFEQYLGARNQVGIGFSYQPARLH